MSSISKQQTKKRKKKNREKKRRKKKRSEKKRTRPAAHHWKNAALHGMAAVHCRRELATFTSANANNECTLKELLIYVVRLLSQSRSCHRCK